MKLHTCLSLLFVLIVTSCVKDVDFEQSEDFTFYPVLTASLVNFERTAVKFYEGADKNQDIITIKDEVKSEIFNGDFTKENLAKAKLTFDVANSINRPFNIKIDFVDADGKIKQTISLDVEGSRGGEDVSFLRNEVFVGQKLNDLKESENIILTFLMLKGDVNDSGRIKLRSKATFHYAINTAD